MWTPTETTYTLAGLLQSLVPLIALTAYIPQWRTFMRNKSSANVSLSAWGIWCAGNLINLFYAIVQYRVTGFGVSLVISTVCILLFMLINMAFIFYYRAKTGR